MPSKKFILKTLIIRPPGPLKVYYFYFSTEFTVSNHPVVIPNQAATSIYLFRLQRSVPYVTLFMLSCYYALLCNCKGYTSVLHCSPGGTI